jgi:hypothetical protein
MREADIGIRTNGTHDEALTALEGACIDMLQGRGAGVKSAISAENLTVGLGLDYEDAGIRGADGEELDPDEIERKKLDIGKRKTRALINHLIISHEIPIICKAGPQGGYFLAGSPTEVEEFYRTFHRRAMTALLKASRGKKASFVSIMTQLSFGFETEDNKKEAVERMRFIPDGDKTPAWVQMVTTFLGRLAEDPQKYAHEIRKIQTTYGDIFVPRETISLLRTKTAEFQELLSKIEPVQKSQQ